MDKWQKEAIKRFRELHPEISDETWNEAINGVGGSFNHIIKIETPQPLFTLTPEEVELVERSLIALYDIFDTDVERGIYPISDELKREMEEVKLLLTRIKQWQNEYFN